MLENSMGETATKQLSLVSVLVVLCNGAVVGPPDMPSVREGHYRGRYQIRSVRTDRED